MDTKENDVVGDSDDFDPMEELNKKDGLVSNTNRCDERGYVMRHSPQCSVGRKRRQSLLVPRRFENMRVERYCVGFKAVSMQTGSRMDYVAAPALPFRPIGFMVIGAKSGCKIHSVQVGQHMTVIASQDPVPAHFFEAGYTFEQLKELFNKEYPVNQYETIFQAWMKSHPFVSSRLNFDMPSLTLGMTMRFQCEGELEGGVAWGWAELSM